MRKQHRQSVNYLEFKGGYDRIPREWIEQVIQAYRVRSLVKADLRVFAAVLENRAQHPDSKVDLYRIVNARSSSKGVRRLSRSEISKRVSRVGGTIDLGATGNDGLVRVSRKMAQVIATGRCGATEAIVLLFYCLRRIRQRKPMRRLHPDERYARFRYADLTELSGSPKANLSRAVSRLRDRGLLSTAEVAKQNENALGQVFVDGSLVSLTAPSRPGCALRNESTTALRRFDNAPRPESITLRNEDPKTEIRNGSQSPTGACTEREWERIRARARQMLSSQVSQVA